MKNAASRTIALGLALLLQLGLAIILTGATRHLRERFHPLREMIWIIPPPPPAPRAEIRNRKPSTGLRAIPPIVPSPPATMIAPPLAAIQGLGQQLNDCLPEKYGSLPPERRAACIGLGPKLVRQAPDADLMGTPSRVKNEARWQGELARAHSPALLPCLGGLDVMCVLLKMADGSLSDFGDPKTWPIYQTKQLPPEDFYKIEQAYAEWHKDHPSKQAADNTNSVSR